MRIALVAPSLIPIPGSGGIERVVYNLSDELVSRGHEVYVYALPGSASKAIVIPYGHRGYFYNIREFVRQTIPEDIDIVHDHTHALVIGREPIGVPTLSTIHTEAGLNTTVKCPVYVSKTKLLQSSNKNFGAYVHNGIDLKSYAYSDVKEDFLLYLGRIDYGKGVEDAVRIGERTGIRTIIAGPVWNMNLFKKIRPIIDRAPNITFVGEVHGEKKKELLSHAKWLIFPTEHGEQFGLVLVEALASGTPVAAIGKGAIPEVLQGLPMFVCKDLEYMEQLVSNDSPVDPLDLRNYVAERFTKEKMTDKYIELYKRAIAGWKKT